MIDRKTEVRPARLFVLAALVVSALLALSCGQPAPATVPCSLKFSPNPTKEFDCVISASSGDANSVGFAHMTAAPSCSSEATCAGQFDYLVSVKLKAAPAVKSYATADFESGYVQIGTGSTNGNYFQKGFEAKVGTSGSVGTVTVQLTSVENANSASSPIWKMHGSIDATLAAADGGTASETLHGSF